MKIHRGDCPSSDSLVALKARLDAYSHSRSICEYNLPSTSMAKITAEMRVLEIRIEALEKKP
jgi:hypothetical protein